MPTDKNNENEGGAASPADAADAADTAGAAEAADGGNTVAIDEGRKPKKPSRRARRSSVTKNKKMFRASVYDTAQEAVVDGYLSKKSTGARGKYCRRFFEASGHYLKYWDHRVKDEVPKGTIDLHHVVRIVQSGSKHDKIFLELNHEEHGIGLLKLKAEGPADAQRWVDALLTVTPQAQAQAQAQQKEQEKKQEKQEAEELAPKTGSDRGDKDVTKVEDGREGIGEGVREDEAKSDGGSHQRGTAQPAQFVGRDKTVLVRELQRHLAELTLAHGSSSAGNLCDEDDDASFDRYPVEVDAVLAAATGAINDAQPLLGNMQPALREALEQVDTGMSQALRDFAVQTANAGVEVPPGPGPATCGLFVDWLVGRGMVEVMLMWLQSLGETQAFQRRTASNDTSPHGVVQQQAQAAAAVARAAGVAHE